LLLSGLVGLVVGRIVFVTVHFSQFGLNPFQWLDVFSRPGITGLAAVLAAGLYLYRFAGHAKWDEFEILDFSVVGLAAALFFISLGQFFDGTAFGTATSLPWGIVFPGVLEKHHPTQMYLALFYLGLWMYLSWVEYRYRTFQWYRGGKNTAQTGFLVSVFLISFGTISGLMSLIKPAAVSIRGYGLDGILYLVVVLVGVWLLGVRSHRLSWSKGSGSKGGILQRFRA
jgi:prolipoprotein diacylglyceryltransferase